MGKSAGTFRRNAEASFRGSRSMGDLLGAFLDGSAQAAARIITLAENKDPRFFDLMGAIYPRTGKAYVIGITGASGTGKSTLTDAFAALLREREFTVGIIAVDPSSPFAGGALLGDRIRMQRLYLDPGIFIRSQATRGRLGGLAPATKNAVKVLDAFGKDFIIVETVGAGQDEVDIAGTADTTILVLTPGLGDSIQSMKAGIMEIADVYVINKADREGADALFDQVRMRTDQDLELRKDAWKAPVLRTVAIYNKGIAELDGAIEAHRNYLLKSGRMQELRRERIKHEILHLLKEEVAARVLGRLPGDRSFDELVDGVASGRKDPYAGVREMVEAIFPTQA